MLVKQVSVFLENVKGRLYEVSKVLADENINLNGISLADTTDYGILRAIVSNPEEAKKVLKDNNFLVELTDVIAIAIKDEPGGMAQAFDLLDKGDVSMEYLYAITKTKDNMAVLIVKTDEVERALDVMKSGGIRILAEEELYSL